jgi:hypothetical protein
MLLLSQLRPVSKKNESNRSIPLPVFKLLLIILYLQLFHFIIFEKSVRIVFYVQKLTALGPTKKEKLGSEERFITIF